MGNLLSLFSLFSKSGKSDPETVDIHDVDVVCCSTVQESSSDEDDIGNAHAGTVQRHGPSRRSVS